MSRTNKTVSFNLNDPFENEMYEYSKKYSNFSGFVKRLIQNAMNGQVKFEQEASVNNSKTNSVTPTIEQSRFNKDFMRQLI